MVYSASGGPITLCYELQFNTETEKSEHDREDMCVMQVVMFPPVPGSATDSDPINQPEGSRRNRKVSYYKAMKKHFHDGILNL